MSHVKNYDVGQIRLDLLKAPNVQDAPYMQYTHELPLLSFGDVQHSINLTLVFNYERYRSEKAAGDPPFFIAPGFKLNLQKRLFLDENSNPTAFQGENGKIISLTAFGNKYTFDDESQRIIRKTQKQLLPSVGGNVGADGDVLVNEYIIEYPDFSQEKYNEAGRLIEVYDKYSSTPILSYTYQDNGRVTSIEFRNGHEILFSYESNKLTAITFNNQVTTFNYTNGMLNYVEHYTGVRYYYFLTKPSVASPYDSYELPECDFKVKASADENGVNVFYSTELTLREFDNGSNVAIDIIEKIGNNAVNTMTYKPARSLLYNMWPCRYVDIVDNSGTETRVQLFDNKAVCSYEITNGAPDFSENANSIAASPAAYSS